MDRVKEITEEFDISQSPKSQKLLQNILKTKKWGSCDNQTIFDEFDRREQLKVEISQKISNTKQKKAENKAVNNVNEIYVEDSRLDKFAEEFEQMKIQKQSKKAEKAQQKIEKEQALQKQLDALNEFMNSYKKGKEAKQTKKETKIQVQEALKPIQESLADKIKKLGI